MDSVAIDPYASHLPPLSRVLSAIGGSVQSILEIGSGFYSTPLLRAFAVGRQCEHVVLESIHQWRAEVSSLFDVDIETFNVHDPLPLAVATRPWDLVFIDCELEKSRARIAQQLRKTARIILLHDSNPDWDNAYGYSKIIGDWEHHRQFTECYPNTLLLTNDDEAWRRLSGQG